MPTASKPIRVVCSYCGSTDVSRDAWGEWEEARQQWTLRQVFDAAYCHRCDAERTLCEEAIEPLPPSIVDTAN